MFIGLMCLFALAIVVVLIKQVYTASQKKKEEAAIAAGEVFYQGTFKPCKTVQQALQCGSLGNDHRLICSGIPNIAGAKNIGWMYLGRWLGLFAIALLFRKFKCGLCLHL